MAKRKEIRRGNKKSRFIENQEKTKEKKNKLEEEHAKEKKRQEAERKEEGRKNKIEEKQVKEKKKKQEKGDKLRKPKIFQRFLKIITKKIALINFIIALVLGIIILLFTRKPISSTIWFFSIFVFLFLYLFMKEMLKEANRIKKMESVFPDFLQLMASNLRAGITIDRSILLSARKEFDPLDKEIIKVGKELMTGKKINEALSDMSRRINSEKISRTIELIISGIRSGGNIAILLEETGVSMRERNFVEKRAASNVLMYVIFIFFATGVGAPVLFALSSVLVSVLTEILSTIPPIETGTNLPFTLTKINISTTFITYFSVVFLITTDILGSLVLGLVNKGEEKAGIRYMIPLIAMSLATFFVVRIVLLNYFSGIF